VTKQSPQNLSDSHGIDIEYHKIRIDEIGGFKIVVFISNGMTLLDFRTRVIGGRRK